jgi:hypothetical protein
MKRSELKKMLISSLDQDKDPAGFPAILENEGVSYGFSRNFSEKITEKLFSAVLTVNREVDFVKSLNFVFYRVALTGIAAIVVLLISIFLMEGSLSFNSFLGLSDSYDESIVSLLTGN